jgi:16S rRNA G1207 methylase RsmC
MEHYFSRRPTSAVREDKVSLKLRGIDLTLITVSGVFSSGKVDPATRLLIENSEIVPGSDILDLGCGYGAVGCSIARSCPECKVVMSDVNERALGYARKNVKLNRLCNCRIVSSDVFSDIPESFDAILVNPPINAGRKLCNRMIKESAEHLREQGTLQLVARHNKGGRYYSGIMEEAFGNLRTIAKKGGFRVYISRRS